jgi:hypothetical protein
MTTPQGVSMNEAVSSADPQPECPCGGEMWFLRFGYESWVCRRNTRHWFRPVVGRWSGEAQAFARPLEG